MLSFCGIDVSKDRLDVMVLPDEYSSSVPNDPAGWAILVEQLRGFSITAIGIEASGGYERGAVRSLQAAGMPVRQVNPFKLRQFAKASGVLAKNDPLDARMIASFVGIMPTRPAQRTTPAAEQLVEMLAVRRQLSAEKIAAENASRLLEDLMLQRLSRRRIARLAADIELLDKRLVEIVATDATLAHRYRLLTSMPGVGRVLACTLMALLPELGGMSRLGSLEVDNQLELSRELYRQIAGRDAFQDFVHVIRAPAKACTKIDSIADQPAVIDMFAVSVDGG